MSLAIAWLPDLNTLWPAVQLSQRFRISFNPSTAVYLHGKVTSAINAAAIAVHKALGPGFLEAIYEEALCVELDKKRVAYQRQLPVRIRYEGVPVGLYRLDLVVESKIVVEVKAVSGIDAVHMATVFAYLKATGLQVGLIVNFAVEVVRIKRVFRGVHGVKEDRNLGNPERLDSLAAWPPNDLTNGVSLSPNDGGHKDSAHDTPVQDPQLVS